MSQPILIQLKSEVTIRRIASPEDIAASQALRFRVWSQQEGVALKANADGCIADELDKTAYHWGAFDGAVLVGSARLSIHRELETIPNAELFSNLPIVFPVASMNRLVVDQTCRGLGIAKELDKLRISYARSAGAKAVAITAAINNPSRIASLGEINFVLVDRVGTEKWSQDLAITPLYLIL